MPEEKKIDFYSDDYFMKEALKQAKRAFEENEIPIGAVVVANNRIIGRGYNQVERLKDSTAHAEMIAITAACENLGSKYLEDCTLFVTLEPCLMCTGAIQWARLSKIVYGAPEPKFGFKRISGITFRHGTEIISGCMEEECSTLMKTFFLDKRNKDEE